MATNTITFIIIITTNQQIAVRCVKCTIWSVTVVQAIGLLLCAATAALLLLSPPTQQSRCQSQQPGKEAPAGRVTIRLTSRTAACLPCCWCSVVIGNGTRTRHCAIRAQPKKQSSRLQTQRALDAPANRVVSQGSSTPYPDNDHYITNSQWHCQQAWTTKGLMRHPQPLPGRSMAFRRYNRGIPFRPHLLLRPKPHRALNPSNQRPQTVPDHLGLPLHAPARCPLQHTYQACSHLAACLAFSQPTSARQVHLQPQQRQGSPPKAWPKSPTLPCCPCRRAIKGPRTSTSRAAAWGHMKTHGRPHTTHAEHAARATGACKAQTRSDPSTPRHQVCTPPHKAPSVQRAPLSDPACRAWYSSYTQAQHTHIYSSQVWTHSTCWAHEHCSCTFVLAAGAVATACATGPAPRAHASQVNFTGPAPHTHARSATGTQCSRASGPPLVTPSRQPQAVAACLLLVAL